MSSSPTVTLTTYEMEWASRVALRRHLEAITAGMSDRYGAVGGDYANGLAKHLAGAAGELAFAKARNLYWAGGVNTFKAGDVGDIQVRTRSQEHFDLIVRATDADDAWFVLVVGAMPTYRVVGAILGRDAKRAEWRADHGGHGLAYFVPQSALLPFAEKERAA